MTVAEVHNSESAGADPIMCSEISSMRDEQDEHWPFRLKEEGRRRPEQDSESLESEQRRMSPVEFRGHGIRQSIEDLRAEFGKSSALSRKCFLRHEQTWKLVKRKR